MSFCSAAAAAAAAVLLQAKTTKKIVLRLQCSECKQSSMKAIKVRAMASFYILQATSSSFSEAGLGVLPWLGEALVLCMPRTVLLSDRQVAAYGCDCGWWGAECKQSSMKAIKVSICCEVMALTFKVFALCYCPGVQGWGCCGFTTYGCCVCLECVWSVCRAQHAVCCNVWGMLRRVCRQGLQRG
jgi:hypothetical protein